MKAKEHTKISINKDEIIHAVEEDLIKSWENGKLEVPSSPFEAASALAFHSILFLKGTKTFPTSPEPPSEQEF